VQETLIGSGLVDVETPMFQGITGSYPEHPGNATEVFRSGVSLGDIQEGRLSRPNY
jgi:hypothetical protein